MNYKVVNCKTRLVLITGLSHMEALSHAEELCLVFFPLKFAVGLDRAREGPFRQFTV